MMQPEPKTNPARIHVYKDKAGRWRWHQKAQNGNITADSGQSYGKRSHAVDAARAAAKTRLVMADTGEVLR